MSDVELKGLALEACVVRELNNIPWAEETCTTKPRRIPTLGMTTDAWAGLRSLRLCQVTLEVGLEILRGALRGPMVTCLWNASKTTCSSTPMFHGSSHRGDC